MVTLVTGGAGFIGSHLVERLLTDHQKVVLLDNFNDYYSPQIKRQNIAHLLSNPNLTVVEADIRDSGYVLQIFQEYGVQRVAHLAAMSGVRNSVNQIDIYFTTNTQGTMNLLDAARQTNVKQFVLASTSSVYGNTEVLPFIETDTADRPLTAYAASKRSAELMAYTFHNLYKMNINVLRFFNVYGLRGRPDMMPLRLFHASQNGTLIKMFNNGDIARDWTYIEDNVSGIASALNTPLGYEIINIGMGHPIALRDFVGIIENLTGKTIQKENVPTPLSDPLITFCNNQKARNLLNFAPKVDVEEGLARTWEWFKQTQMK
jgi:UDP-glucuronate 4-epimerase